MLTVFIPAFHCQILLVIILPDFLNGIRTGRSEIRFRVLSTTAVKGAFIFQLLSNRSLVVSFGFVNLPLILVGQD